LYAHLFQIGHAVREMRWSAPTLILPASALLWCVQCAQLSKIPKITQEHELYFICTWYTKSNRIIGNLRFSRQANDRVDIRSFKSRLNSSRVLLHTVLLLSWNGRWFTLAFAGNDRSHELVECITLGQLLPLTVVTIASW
jgi:hypothetical protein